MQIIGITLLTLMVLYLLAIMPRMVKRPDYTTLQGWYYAHRGFYDNKGEAPENSMLAFQKAVEAGYGIEFDVQLTKDKIPVVFHDERLKRVCKVKGKVRDYTYEELKKLYLYKSKQQIPLLEEVLKLVDGKVPLIIEIKIHEEVNTVCSIVDKLIKEYKGIYCIESFHPMAVRWYRKHRPEVIRGQLSSNFKKLGKKETFDLWLVHFLLLNFLAKPDFIAYEHLRKGNPSRLLCKYLYKSLSVAWTIKSQKELTDNQTAFDLFIFEGFHPEKM